MKEIPSAKHYASSNRVLLICGLDLCISSKSELYISSEQLWNCILNEKTGFGTYPINCAEVHSFSKIETLIEATVISSWKGDHKLSGTLIGSINLGEKIDKH